MSAPASDLSMDGERDALRARLIARIRADGPMSVGAYMAEALHDPRAGFYATRDPLTAGADFVTAPMVSQMFGELLGLWAVQAWLDLDGPQPLHLVELGPGTGAMMADVLRAARVHPPILSASLVTLVETSPALEAVQAKTLSRAPIAIRTARALDAVGPGASLILANEFLDCLPIRQIVRAQGVWRERVVALDPSEPERLAFALSPGPAPTILTDALPAHLADAHDGALVEIRLAQEPVLDALAARFADHPGHALFIDYGPADTVLGDTLQALAANDKVDPLANPGGADLTARVDFGALARMARAKGLDVHGPVEQGGWLKGLGLEARAAALMQSQPEAKQKLAAQVYRLTDPSQMGALFKVLCVSSPGAPTPPGFPAQEATS